MTTLRALSGQLNWVTSQARPDASFLSCQLANNGKDASIRNLKEAKVFKLHKE